jgi:spermidine synthase
VGFTLRYIKKVNPVLIFGILILPVLPFTTTLLINYLKNIVYPIGVMISMFQIFIASFLLLIPFCLLSGFLFTFIVQCFSQIRNKNETGSIYGYESVGSVVGDLLSGLLFIFLFSSIESLLVLTIINGLILVLMNLKKTTRKFLWAPSLVAFTALALLFIHPEKKIRNLLYPNQTIVVSKDSPYGNIVITRRENMWIVYNNNVLLFNSENFMINEETVHFAMLQHPNPKAILLVSGGLSGQITELEKYKPALIDYVEDNRWLLSLMKDTIEKKMGKNVTIHLFQAGYLTCLHWGGMPSCF